MNYPDKVKLVDVGPRDGLQNEALTVATEHKVEFLPFLLDNIATKKELNQADGIHPNTEGEKIMTDNVYKALKPMLSR